MKVIRRFFGLLLLSAAAVLSGCVGTLKIPVQGSNYGAPPVNPEPAIRTKMETILRDPDSARYRIGHAERAYLNSARLRGGNVVWQGHVVYFEVNAKNGYGGYTGFEPHMALFNPDSVGIYDIYRGWSHPLIYLAKDVEDSPE